MSATPTMMKPTMPACTVRMNGSSPAEAMAGSSTDRNAMMSQKITAPSTGPNIVAAPPSSSTVQRKNVSDGR